MAARCFYCGADAQSPTAKTAGAFTPVSSTALVPAAVPAAAIPASAAPAAPAASRDPNTHCPICKNAIVAAESPAYSCPSCQSRLECLYAAPKPLPGSTAMRPGLSELCINHATNQAVARCRTCRKAICDTCLFRGPTGSYCPECAVKPDEVSLRSKLNWAIASLVCGAVGLLCLAGFFFLAVASRRGGASESESAIAGFLFLASPLVSLVGVGTGFTSRDSRNRSPLGLVGIILSLFVIAIVALLFVFMAKGTA
jgi:hypothetical protein